MYTDVRLEAFVVMVYTGSFREAVPPGISTNMKSVLLSVCSHDMKQVYLSREGICVWVWSHDMKESIPI